MTSLVGDGVIDGAFCLGCVVPVLLASQLCCDQTLFLMLSLVLALKVRVVVVCWALV